MKQIKCIKQLKAEKHRLNRRQVALEMMMHQDWTELKSDLNPISIFKEKFRQFFQRKKTDNPANESILKRAFSFGAGLLAIRFAEGGGKKFSDLFKK